MSVIAIYQGIAQICLRSLFIVLFPRSFSCACFGSCSALDLFPIPSTFLPSSSFYAKYDIQQHNFSAFDILPRSVFSFMCVYPFHVQQICGMWWYGFLPFIVHPAQLPSLRNKRTNTKLKQKNCSRTRHHGWYMHMSDSLAQWASIVGS